jgi:thioredoxin reductase (NADPH)
MITIYGKPQCPFCDKAKNLCEQRGYKYEYKTLGKDYQIEELLETFPGAKTVPQIIINSQKVGGFNDFENYLEDTGYNGTGHGQ